MVIFLGESQSACSHSGPPMPFNLESEKSLWGSVEWSILQDGCPSFHPAISVKAINRMQSSNPI